MREEKISINDLNINYKIAGSGPAVLILHGWGGSSDSWEKIQKILSERNYSIICPDLPGFGKSQTPLSPWTLQDYIHFVLKFAENLHLNSFYLIGHSFGGRIAVKMAVNHSSMIKKLILCDPAGIKIKPGFTPGFFISAVILLV